METILIKYKIKPQSLNKVTEWILYFNTYREEITKLLKDEGIWVESAFIEKADTENFIYYYLKAEDINTATAIFLNSKNPHDLFHKNFMAENLEFNAKLELLIDMDRIVV